MSRRMLARKPAPAPDAAARPLPYLDRIQRSFAHDLSSVRAHTGPNASQAARAVGANAFTSGEDVVFAGTPSLRTAAHEAAHVVQQRRGVALDGGIGKRGDVYEQEAASAAERVVAGKPFHFGDIGVFAPRQAVLQRDEPASAPATPPPLRYSTTRWTLHSPKPGLTESDIETRLGTMVKTFTVTGIQSGMRPETRLYLLYTLRQVAAKENWGQEMDLIAPIAHATTPGAADPVGRVTVRIDAAGNADVELIATGATPASAATTLAAATTQLQTDPGFSAVKDDGTAKWNDAEISDVAAALSMVPKGDRDALSGVELIRVKSVPGGQAKYFIGTVTPDGLTTVPASLKVADDAFASGDPRFYGGTKGTVPPVYFAILHEVGHAVEAAAARAALEPRNAAYVEANKDVEAAKEAKKKGDKKAYKAASKKYAADAKTTLAADAVYKATLVDPKIVKALETDAETKKTAASTALSSAQASLGLAKPELVASGQRYIDEVVATDAAIATFVTDAQLDHADILALEQSVLDEMERRRSERLALAAVSPTHPILTRFKTVSDAQDEWFTAARAAVHAKTRSLRLQKFVDLVNAKKIEPFTAYAKKNWPFNPAEFYADAYALWRTDPDYLSKNSPAIFDFFEKETYRE